MQHQQGIDPPVVLSFKEVFEDPETNQFSVLQEDTSSSSATSSEEENKDLKVPKFMMRCEEEKLQELLEEILKDHRCMACRRYLDLCCGGGVYHDVNCWSENLKAQVTWDMIAGIRNYRLEVLNGSMK